MPVQPNRDWLAAKPVLAHGYYGTLRYEEHGFRYWLADDDSVWVEEYVPFGNSGWNLVYPYKGEEMP